MHSTTRLDVAGMKALLLKPMNIRYDLRMFIKLTRSGGHSYVQLVESYRNEEG